VGGLEVGDYVQYRKDSMKFFGHVSNIVGENIEVRVMVLGREVYLMGTKDQIEKWEAPNER